MTTDWHVFKTTKARAEAATKAWFDFRDVEAWFPTETAWRSIPRGPKRKVAYERPVVPGYVFARFTATPEWHIIRDRLRTARPIIFNGQPMLFSERDMEAMALVPQRIADLREMEREARRVRPGDKAEITDGQFAGWAVDVVAVQGSRIRFTLPLLGGAKGEADAATVRKVA